VTPAFAAEHGMAGEWPERLPGPTFYRRVTGLDPEAKRIEIDTKLYLSTVPPRKQDR